jgi:TRAP-type mannitol/chloroaromatic compound transport system permease small subunit
MAETSQDKDLESVLEGVRVEKELDVSADSPAVAIFATIHPIGIAAIGALIAAVVGHVAVDTERLFGNLSILQWAVLVAVVGLSLVPPALNAARTAIEAIAAAIAKIIWILAWGVFIVQLINVVTNFLNPRFEQDIQFGELTSLAWQLFGVIALLGLPYGVRAAINPRIDFWWSDWSDRKKAWLDFVMHTFFFLPFLYSMTILLKIYAFTALGQRRGDGTWPSGWRVWETWEDSPDADQLPVGPIKALILVGFILFALQIVAEIIKTGFVLAGRREYAGLATGDEFQRIE